MSDEDLVKMENKNAPQMEVKDEDLKPNAVLLVGDYESFESIGDWIAFDLAAKVTFIIIFKFFICKEVFRVTILKYII